jgi:hypothetical protein
MDRRGRRRTCAIARRAGQFATSERSAGQCAQKDSADNPTLGYETPRISVLARTRWITREEVHAALEHSGAPLVSRLDANISPASIHHNDASGDAYFVPRHRDDRTDDELTIGMPNEHRIRFDRLVAEAINTSQHNEHEAWHAGAPEFHRELLSERGIFVPK